MRVKTSGLILSMGIIAFSASPAIAAFHTATSPGGGALAETSASGGTVYAKDIKCDNYRTKAVYRSAGQPTRDLVDSSGCGTEVKYSPGYITSAIQACVIIPVNPDICSAFQ